MVDNVLEEASKLCAQVPSFGEALRDIQLKRGFTQEQLAKCISRSEAEVSHLLNNQIPRNLDVRDMHKIAEDLDCNRAEFAVLVAAFICHRFTSPDLLDIDVY